jgi:hypothetical protein
VQGLLQHEKHNPKSMTAVQQSATLHDGGDEMQHRGRLSGLSWSQKELGSV